MSDDMLSGLTGSGRAMHSSGAPEPKKTELAKDEDESGERSKTAVCKISVKIEKAEQTGDTRALQALVEKVARTNVCQVTGAIKLRVTLDSAGKITSVVVVSGDGGAGKALVRKLTGATSSTRATGQTKGTVEITVTAEAT